MNLKTFYKFLMMFFIFISFNDIVLGANLFEKCNSENKCIPICVYSNKNLSESESDRAYIGYYYDNERNSTDPLSLIWEFGVYSGIDSVKFDNLMAIDTVWDDSKMSSNEEPGLYINLINDFKCPKFMSSISIGSGRDSEKKHQYWFNNEGSLELSYSFADEFVKVLDITYYNMKIEGSKTPTDTIYGTLGSSIPGFYIESDLEVLGIHDSDIKNIVSNSLLDDDSKLKKVCEYFNDQNSSSYINKLITQNEGGFKYGDIVADKINTVASVVGVRDKSLYSNYSTIKFLVDKKQAITIKNQGKNMCDITGQCRDYNLERLDLMVSKPLEKSLNNVQNKCNDLGYNVRFDVEETVENFVKEMEIFTYKNVIIDLESTYDCGTFFSGNLAKMIKNAYFIIEIGSLLIFIALSILDYAKVILNGDQDEMKKTNKNTIIRLIIVVSLFLLPAIINFVLGIFNIEGFDSEHPLCVEIKNK